MKYTRAVSLVRILGCIWMPYGAPATIELELRQYDVENIGEPTRENVACWIATHAGDFSSITDFWASLEINGETVEIPWQSEENELQYMDITFPIED